MSGEQELHRSSADQAADEQTPEAHEDGSATKAREEPQQEKPAAKLDPESLAIRTPPPRAIRFRRSVVIGGAAAASLALAGAAWLALQPQIFVPATRASDEPQPAAGLAEDAVAGLPETYADVPKLGPPLPGDLGRPILRARERALADPAQGAVGVDAERAAREKQAAEREAAHRSALLIALARNTASGTIAESSATALPGLSLADQPPAGEAAEDHKTGFVSALDMRGDINPHRLAMPASPNMLMAGSVIAASLLTGLNSDLPGFVIAQVTQNVFDSATGRILLVPQGARLVGRYDSVVAYGQKRALVVWQRLIMPDGSSLRLDNMPASDPSGFSGLADEVDFHSWRLIKGAAIASLLGVGSELSVSGESDLAEAIRESAQSNVSRAGDQLTRRNLDIQPTITVRPGAAVRLIVQRDLILAPWKGEMAP
mgnify:CR=1 FL=1